MKQKLLSLALALTLCLGLTVPAFAENMTETIDGITIAVNSDNATLTYTGSGTFTEEHAGYGLEYLLYLMDSAGSIADTVTLNIGSGITVDTQLLELMQEVFFDYGVKYVNINYGNSSTVVEPPVGGFTDVKKNDYFADPVVWAVGKKITAGTSATTFSPNQNCTVAQILTFLWRAYGSPKSNQSNPFSDVKSSDYYYNAALWAYSRGIVTGSTFGGDRPCTRSMAVNYMWKADASRPFYIEANGYLSEYRYTGGNSDTVVSNMVIPDYVVGIYPFILYSCQGVTSVTIPSSVTAISEGAFDHCNGLTDIYYEGSEAQWNAIDIDPYNRTLSQATIHYNSKTSQQPVNTGFTDVPSTADYAQAVKWAVDNGVTGGTSETTFSPEKTCTRGQIVTFLYAALGA